MPAQKLGRQHLYLALFGLVFIHTCLGLTALEPRGCGKESTGSRDLLFPIAHLSNAEIPNFPMYTAQRPSPVLTGL